MSKIEQVFVDMDGVLADFDTHIELELGMTCEQFNEISDDAVGKYMHSQIDTGQGFFEHLPTMNDIDVAREFIQQLTERGIQVAILSCATRSNFDAAVKQKKIWLDRHGFGHLDAHFTETRRCKAKHASHTSLLIDDNIKCITYFGELGSAIHHSSWNKTIETFTQHFH